MGEYGLGSEEDGGGRKNKGRVGREVMVFSEREVEEVGGWVGSSSKVGKWSVGKY